jgi:hypothetical protein
MQPVHETEMPIVEEVYFSSKGRRLHGELVYPDNDRVLGVAVIAGPHPLLGGNMHNNVVRGIGDELARTSRALLPSLPRRRCAGCSFARAAAKPTKARCCWPPLPRSVPSAGGQRAAAGMGRAASCRFFISSFS